MIEKALPIDITYTNFAKAFDRVPHQRLLPKMKILGITGNTLSWIEAFLSESVYVSKRVFLLGKSHERYTTGIRTGSYTFCRFHKRYMPDAVSSMCQLFADDAKIFRGILSKEHLSALQEDLGRLDEWSEKWQLAFKVHKWINVSHFILEQEIHITNAK